MYNFVHSYFPFFVHSYSIIYIYQRSLTKKGNYSLNQTAKLVGVKNFDKFHNYG